MMKSWQTDTYLLGKQKGGCACGYKNEHQQYRSSFTNESVERMRKGWYEYLSFWWRTKSQLLHRQWHGTVEQATKITAWKMRKVQERRCATPYTFENLDWLPFVIDSHAWEIAKAKGADEAKRNRRRRLGCCPQRKSPCPTLLGRKTKALLKGWLGEVSLHWSFIVFDVFTFY